LKLIAADSAAILDSQFKPQFIVAAVSVVVEPPYRLAEPIFREVETGFDVIVHEAQLCLNLLAQVKADVVHLDMSLGGVSVEVLTPLELANLCSGRAGRQNILKILPHLRKIAGEIKRLHDIDMLAIGKESVLVRIAELTVCAESHFVCLQKSG
jgi:hypothetical protein